MLSVSESPPLFCGIPDDPPDADEPPLEELEAAGELADELFELDDPPPHPATTRHAITSRPAAHRLIELFL